MTKANPIIRSKILDVLTAHSRDDVFNGYPGMIYEDGEPGKIADEITTALMIDQQPKTRIERLKDEFERIQTRHQSMKLFMMTDGFKRLDYEERKFMDDESRAMNALMSAMKMRLNHYGVYV